MENSVFVDNENVPLVVHHHEDHDKYYNDCITKNYQSRRKNICNT